MTHLLERIAVAVAIGLAGAVLTAPALAQDYPNRHIQLVIPYAAGGGTDVLARIVAEHLSAILGQRVVPENRPGAGTALAAGVVARAAPNGYTLLFSTLAHSLNATMSASLPFDSVNDFEFVGKVGQVGLVLMTNPQYVKANDLRELVRADAASRASSSSDRPASARRCTWAANC
ncbi:MAG: hypothetical protein IPO58_26735 [Betaproteobacteria bacterium]|nr:hypothetical protein [Betaproteobacteria bacterium]